MTQTYRRKYKKRQTDMSVMAFGLSV